MSDILDASRILLYKSLGLKTKFELDNLIISAAKLFNYLPENINKKLLQL